MKINQEEYTEGEAVKVNCELDDGDGWYWKLKNKIGLVHFDKYGMYVQTNEGDKVRPQEITHIKKLT